MRSVKQLRARAIAWSLFEPISLKRAVEKLGFVQADPIRPPARAQDLILRHRVHEYQNGQLEALYASLELEEDYLYAYGFLPRTVYQLLHPRRARALSVFEKKVLAAVQRAGRLHPRELALLFGDRRVTNGWGGYSRASKAALERLHYFGAVRIGGREGGIRTYEPAERPQSDTSPESRAQRLAMCVAKMLAPVRKTTLSGIVSAIGRTIGGVKPAKVIERLLESEELEGNVIDGTSYVWPTRKGKPPEESSPTVRFLAPFDPLVWDRKRFEHFWGWEYRFEAYTPPAKRVRGYYALPVLWRDDIIGWANVSKSSKSIDAQLGFAQSKPKDRQFSRELEAEISRMRAFLISS